MCHKVFCLPHQKRYNLEVQNSKEKKKKQEMKEMQYNEPLAGDLGQFIIFCSGSEPVAAVTLATLVGVALVAAGSESEPTERGESTSAFRRFVCFRRRFANQRFTCNKIFLQPK